MKTLPWSFLVVTILGSSLAACGNEHGSQTPPLRILVTNDDGYAAEGIDAIVAALAADPRNEVVVSAPSGNRSGSSDATGPSARCGDLSITTSTTLSGYPATAVNGCPADSVNYALANLYPAEAPPQLVVSGINEGQNISLPVATRLSGTVGAARTAARRGIPAIAASQGTPANNAQYDYSHGVASVLEWIEARRDELTAGGVVPVDVTNLNIPSCASGTELRGTLIDVPLATSPGNVLANQDCASTLMDPSDDVEAFINGFIVFSQVPLQNG